MRISVLAFIDNKISISLHVLRVDANWMLIDAGSINRTINNAFLSVARKHQKRVHLTNVSNCG